jgi:hypothetical protein
MTLTTKQLPTLEQRMNAMLRRYVQGWVVVWKPDPNREQDALFLPEQKRVEIYAVNEFEAWDVFGELVQDEFEKEAPQEVWNLTDGTIEEAQVP